MIPSKLRSCRECDEPVEWMSFWELLDTLSEWPALSPDEWADRLNNRVHVWTCWGCGTWGYQ